MAKQNKSQLPVLLSVLALLVALILVIFFIVPKTSELKDLSNQVAKKQQDLDLGKKKVASIRNALKLISQAQDDMDKLGVAVPQSPNAEEALAQAQEIASQTEATISQSSVGEASDGYQDLSLTLTGSYGSISSFLEKLSVNMRPVELSGYSIIKNEEEDGVTATLNMLYPYLSQTSDSNVNEEGI